MGHNDVIVDAVEEAGVTTYSTEQMASMLLDLCDVETKVAAARGPVQADLTGGLAEADLDLSELAAKAGDAAAAPAESESEEEAAGHTISALPSPPRPAPAAPARSGPTSTSTRPISSSSSAVPNWARTARRAPASRWRSTTSCPRPACSSWPGLPD